jgi:hypothetical protein
MSERPVALRRFAGYRTRRSVTRRATAVAIVAALGSALVMAATTVPASATPVATATFSSNATSAIVALNSLTVATVPLATATVGPATASIANASSTATAANLDAAITAFTPPVTVPVNQFSVTAPPPASDGGTLLAVPLPPLLSAAVLNGSVDATWPSAATCPTAGAPVAEAAVSTTAATVIGGVPSTALSLASLGVATTGASTALVTEAGPLDTRGVQASATNDIATVDLLGGASGLGTGISININSAPVLTGTATGAVGTSDVSFTPAGGTITIAGGVAANLTPGLAVPISITVGLVSITGSITLNGAPTSVTNTGTFVSGDAALLSVSLTATVAAVVLADVSLDVAPLHVDATSPADGIQCAAAVALPTAIGIDPDRGPTTGGQTVTITGTGFVPGATTVTIGGITIPAAGVTVAPGGNSLTFVTPPHAAGPVDVTVTTPGGTTAALAYTYIPVPPVLTTPGNGDTTTPTPPITGTGTPGDTVTVTEGGTTICTALVSAAGTWSCVPATALACGSHTIVATQESAGGLVSAASNVVTFTVACAPPLAATGASVTPALTIALLLIGVGALLLAGGRRRRTA